MVEIIHPTLGKPSMKWAYTTAEGLIIGHVCRFETAKGKTIRPYFDGKWEFPPAPRPLYGLHRIAQRPNDPVIVVEGEKSAEAAGALFPSHVATTSMGGAGNAAYSDWSALSGRDVTIWPDADEAGLKYAQDVAQLALKAGAKSVSIVDIKGWL